MSMPHPWPLTDREREALAALAAGQLPDVVAEQMCISPLTFRTHLRNVADKVQAYVASRE